MRSRDVLVVVEHERGELRDVTLEMLADARALADQSSGRVLAVLLAGAFRALPDWVESTLPAHGADAVVLVEHEQLEPYLTQAHLLALQDVISRFRPAIVMLAASRSGQDLAPRLAARMRVPFAGDCIGFRLDTEGSLEVVRPVHGDEVHATVVLSQGDACVVTLRPNVAGVGAGRAGRKAELLRMATQIDAADLRARVRSIVPADPASVDLSEAECVVAGGRGARSGEGWRQIAELADCLGASLGASRVAVDRGWAPFERQVGQTGKTVKARLYVACGISGASQHVLGMQASEVIVAINNDKAAPIFKLAHFGAVGDLDAILPIVVDRVRGLRGKQESTGSENHGGRSPGCEAPAPAGQSDRRAARRPGGLHVVVCVQRVLDPALGVAVDEAGGAVVSTASGLAHVLNRADRAALEAALQLVKGAAQSGEVRVTALTLGPPADENVLRSCLARGADAAIRVWDDAIDALDSSSTAGLLARAVSGLAPDLVICGGRSLGWGSGSVPSRVAEILDLPQITGVIALEWDAGRGMLVAQQRLERGSRSLLDCPAPALVAVEASGFPGRYVSWNARRRVATPIRTLGLVDLAVGSADLAAERDRCVTTRLMLPQPRTKRIVSPAASGAALVSMLMRGGVQKAKPRAAGTAEGAPEKVAGEIVQFLQEKGFLPKQ